MKFNWGHGITIAIVIFMGLILLLVANTFKFKSELVAEDYYAQEVAYQSRIEQIKNTQNLDISLEQSLNQVILRLPHEQYKGTLLFFRPSNKALDFEMKLQDSSSKQHIINTKDLKRGLWRVKIDWQANGKPYFYEQEIVLQ